ncbi:S8 family serine peptidase [Dactylosporangium sucinum]|uniref:Uncharacterized protein n=1 Tax=Dactylosporangium sucinum TaxID=1424081 RepID=A0A917UE15_9ACTN|nr:S8 family serine peptidase [Dactylosporangium sucinum]GGM73983.1 hypothetical protein GCM10007977_089430 [Dactylosporangium sucinum]
MRKPAGTIVVATIAALLGTGPAAPAEGHVLGDAATAKAGSYVVVLKQGDVHERAAALAARFGGTVTAEYRAAIRGFAVDDLGEAQARRLAADPSVASVEHNGRVTAAGTQTGPGWGLDRIDQPRLPLDNAFRYPNAGSGITAFIVDSGIKIEHPDFGGRASYGANYGPDGKYGPVDPTDCYGHGTHVAATVGGATYGVAKDVRLVAVRILDCRGNSTDASVLAGIEHVTRYAARPAVASLSVSLAGNKVAVNDALRASINTGVVWSVAAGNAGTDACLTSPGSVTEALVVGASTRTDDVAPFSNRGACVDFYAPGVDIPSAGIPDVQSIMSGTSMAAAYATGAAALVLSAHRAYNARQVHNAVVQSSVDGVLKGVPAGSPNRLLQVRQADPPQASGRLSTLYNPRFGTTEVYARSTDNHLIYAYYAQGWSGWTDLGGNLAGDPTAFSNPATGATEVYARTANNRIAYRRYVNGWSDWTELGSQTVSGNPQVIYNPRFGTTEIYARTSNNRLAFTYFVNGRWTAAWTDLAGALTSDPALIYNPRFGTTEAYVRNATGGVEYKYYSASWSAWLPLEGGMAEGATPSVLFNPRFGSTEVYIRTAAGELQYKTYTTAWSSWTSRPGATLASDPTLLYNPAAKTTEVYARTADNAVVYQYYASAWSSWIHLGAPFAGTPAVIFNPRWGSTEVYTRGASDGHTLYTYYTNGWSGWNDISA